MAEGHGRSYKYWRYDQKGEPSCSMIWGREKRKRDQVECFEANLDLVLTDRHDIHLNGLDDVVGLRTTIGDKTLWTK